VGYFEDGGKDPSYSSYLLAWVPASLEALVEAGVDINPEKCIVWLDTTNIAMRSIIAHVQW
jgi:hypothetical protein